MATDCKKERPEDPIENAMRIGRIAIGEVHEPHRKVIITTSRRTQEHKGECR